MIVLKTGDDGVDVRLSGDELDMLNNVLNEMCNGVRIEDWEFQTRIGWDRNAVRRLLDQIHEAAPHSN
jgi:hypothetical protein